MTITTVPLSKLDDSPFNPRQTYDGIEELAASIKQVGVLQRPVARPGKRGRFELVAGHRRKRGAEAAGLKSIEVEVQELTDEQAKEVQLVENTQRADLAPLEEAAGYQALLDLRERPVPELAERVGKSASYVYKRLQLLKLTPKARKAFEAGDVSLTVALYLARIPHKDLQLEALERVSRDHFGELCGAANARRVIQSNYMLVLKESCFKPADPDLPGGPCGECPKRTGASPDLFGDVEDDNVCTDPKCHAAKVAAHAEREVEKHKAKGLPVLTAKESAQLFASYNPKQLSGSRGAGYVLADEKPYDHELPELNGRRKWKTVLGKHMPETTMAFDGTGAPVLLLEQKALKKARKAAGLVKPRKKPATSGSKKAKAGLGVDARRNTELETRVEAAMLDAIIKGVPQAREIAARVAANIVIDTAMSSATDKAAAAFGIEDVGDIATSGSVDDCLALVAMLEAFEAVDTDKALAQLVEDLGVDVEALRNDVEQDLARERAAADPVVEQKTAEAADGKPELIMRLGIKREDGWLYFVNKDVNVARTKMVKPGQRKPKKGKGSEVEVLVKTDIRKREDGWLYFLDDQGDLSRRPFLTADQVAKKKTCHDAR